jgi:hypothetical protein
LGKEIHLQHLTHRNRNLPVEILLIALDTSPHSKRVMILLGDRADIGIG